MSGPRVTIAIPTYNRAEGYLQAALESALAQDVDDLEIVVSDNASTDRTAELVADLADQRVRYMRQPTNLGVNGNFNACVATATGRFLVLLHDDDLLDPDFVASCKRSLQESPLARQAGMVRTGSRVIDANGRTIANRPNRSAATGVTDLLFEWFDGLAPMYFCNTLYRTDALRAAGGFTSRRALYIDVAAVLRIAAIHPTVNVPEEKASFRRHDGSNGSVQSIAAWCDDSQFLIDLACELVPDRAEEISDRGRYFFSANNYGRAARIRDPGQRLRAYWTVYRHFGFRLSPARFLAARRWRRLRSQPRPTSS